MSDESIPIEETFFGGNMRRRNKKKDKNAAEKPQESSNASAPSNFPLGGAQSDASSSTEASEGARKKRGVSLLDIYLEGRGGSPITPDPEEANEKASDVTPSLPIYRSDLSGSSPSSQSLPSLVINSPVMLREEEEVVSEEEPQERSDAVALLPSLIGLKNPQDQNLMLKIFSEEQDLTRNILLFQKAQEARMTFVELATTGGASALICFSSGFSGFEKILLLLVIALIVVIYNHVFKVPIIDWERRLSNQENRLFQLHSTWRRALSVQENAPMDLVETLQKEFEDSLFENLLSLYEKSCALIRHPDIQVGNISKYTRYTEDLFLGIAALQGASVFSSIYSRIFGKAAENFLESYYEKYHRRISEIANSRNIGEIFRKVAIEISNNYRNQILCLTLEGRIKLSVCLSALMIEYIGTGQLEEGNIGRHMWKRIKGFFSDSSPARVSPGFIPRLRGESAGHTEDSIIDGLYEMCLDRINRKTYSNLETKDSHQRWCLEEMMVFPSIIVLPAEKKYVRSEEAENKYKTREGNYRDPYRCRQEPAESVVVDQYKVLYRR